ncbi:hydroxymethylpyrimidine/phosphomethylpyrimidine kinase [Knoellia remsis]|uniref:Hydroxymethylpyrimidine/phosphomethylpyrimidine kinase n=1 Tax=Knoellia remsis TaxID=407159 RepID=A0A2T0V0K5_9MICO|nr:bifunctional hydroxymethylpyrimidine kinase/phosphomethylpyrimidine kinase [Knoellia remsis]PRY63713.1 hydroxymethylpyrimidine/phosphomethylpyrimidine kinase [Knoellia remsis]
MTPTDTTDGAATRPPVVLSIAGSDPSGGAGIQADLKTFSALGAYGCAAITALTAQSTRGVTGVHVVPPEFVTAQVRTLVDDVALDSVKIGMLADAAIVEAVGELLGDRLGAPAVLDPVMVATSGDRLLDEDAVAAMRELVPRAAVITPNLHEAAVLLGTEVAADVAAMERQACQLVERLGARRVLLKGGHATGEDAVDVWFDGDRVELLRAPRVDTRNTHGTGCTLSSAVAALFPQRASWLEAARDAKDYLTGALRAADGLGIGAGNGPVHHFHDVWGRA